MNDANFLLLFGFPGVVEVLNLAVRLGREGLDFLLDVAVLDGDIGLQVIELLDGSDEAVCVIGVGPGVPVIREGCDAILGSSLIAAASGKGENCSRKCEKCKNLFLKKMFG